MGLYRITPLILQYQFSIVIFVIHPTCTIRKFEDLGVKFQTKIIQKMTIFHQF
jgi:hypothetical protein